MITTLLFFSLILNIIALLSIVILYSRQNRLLDMEKQHEQIIKEMEDVISTYILEMKEENEHFIKKIEQLQQRKQLRKETREKPDQGISQTVAAGIPKHENMKQEVASLVPKQHAAKVYELSMEKRPPQSVHEQSVKQTLQPLNKSSEDYKKNENDVFIERVQTLKKEGLSNDEIAAKLKKGKTEIALLLKFQQKQS